MARALFALALLTFAPLCPAQNLERSLTFETTHPGGVPGGWTVSPPGSGVADDKVVHGGAWSARLERAEGAAGQFTNLSQTIPIDFGGSKIELRGFLRLEDVTGFAGFWMREDGDAGNLQFDSMQGQALKGSVEWKQYSISVPRQDDGRKLFFGVLLGGTGKVWADDLELLVDGKPVWEAAKVEQPKTVLDTDVEFNSGSKLAWTALTKAQVQNLAALGKVWGFLKYHHPMVAAGRRHWDFELFRVAPAVVAAADRAAANAVMVKWLDGLGAVDACQTCAKLEGSDLHLRPAVEWIGNEAALGATLSGKLKAIYQNRTAVGKPFYISRAAVGNPSFDHEPAYPGIQLPDAGYQLLALYRFWNIIEYWFPARDVLGEDWDAVLAEFVPRIALAKDAAEYQRELMALIARAHDTHANLWSSIAVRPPVGACELPVNVRFVENQVVVTSYSDPEAGQATGLKPGDAIVAMDGETVASLREKWAPYYAASNEPTRLRDIGRSMTRGACVDVKLRVRRGTAEVEVTAARVRGASLTQRESTHDLPGDTFRLLSKDVAYLKLSSVKIADAPGYVRKAEGTKGMIIDIRNYPSEFVVFALGTLLVEKETPFVIFTAADLSNPGAFRWGQLLSLTPQAPHYAGKVVILVDEVSQSQAEYTTMAFRVAPGARVVGSTTAGADGNVSAIPLPGGLRSMISGLGVFYPDKKPTQRVGIVPDIEARPTIAGIRAGRDEALEAGLREILGSETPAAEIEKLARK